MTTGPQNAVPFGKYLLLKRLAVGGMAELYLAKDPQNDRLVVIKRILPYLAQETEFVRMFLDEARIAAQLHHPHIITMHELGHLEGSIFIAMEFVEGVDLRKILQQEVKRQMFVPPDIAAWLTSRLCEGLHYAHNRNGPDGKPLGIIHRDVSPQNLMVGFDGEVKLVDFGIAKATSFMERSKPGVIKGKFLYLSPEQLSQERIDHRADLFAIGTMLYEVTTGKSPFYKPTTEAVIYAIRAEDPPPPHLTMSGYPVELSRIIMRCLIKDRSKRYQQAGEIHADLESWMRKESPTTMATVVDYVDKLFGDQQERTSIFIPPNARSERTRVEGKRVSSDSLPTGSGQNAIPRTQSSDAVASSDSPTGSGLQPVGGRTRTGENVPTGSGLSAIPARTNSNPTMPLGPFKSISDETTKPIATGLSERHSPEGRRPTPSPDSIPAITEDRRTVPIRGSEIRAAQKNPSIVTAPETRAVTDRRSGHNHASLDQEHTANTSPVALAQRNFEEMEATAISHSGRLHTGESLVELTPSAPQPSQPSQPATPPPPPAPIKRSRDFPVYPERLPPPVSDSKMPIAEPATMAGRPSNVRQPVPLPSAPPPNTDPSSAANPIPKARSPGDTFADDDVSSFDPEDEQSTMDFRDSALDNLKLQLRRDSKYMIEAADSLFTRKPWLIAVFAFLGVLILGLILIISTRPEKKTVTPIIAHSTVDPVSGETVLPEAPSSELPESGKTMVRFAAPAGTQIVHDGSLFRPNKAYPLFPGSFTLRYQCPRKGKAAGDSINYTVNVDRYRSEPQVVSLKCN